MCYLLPGCFYIIMAIKAKQFKFKKREEIGYKNWKNSTGDALSEKVPLQILNNRFDCEGLI